MESFAYWKMQLAMCSPSGSWLPGLHPWVRWASLPYPGQHWYPRPPQAGRPWELPQHREQGQMPFSRGEGRGREGLKGLPLKRPVPSADSLRQDRCSYWENEAGGREKAKSSLPSPAQQTQGQEPQGPTPEDLVNDGRQVLGHVVSINVIFPFLLPLPGKYQHSLKSVFSCAILGEPSWVSGRECQASEVSQNVSQLRRSPLEITSLTFLPPGNVLQEESPAGQSSGNLQLKFSIVYWWVNGLRDRSKFVGKEGWINSHALFSFSERRHEQASFYISHVVFFLFFFFLNLSWNKAIMEILSFCWKILKSRVRSKSAYFLCLSWGRNTGDFSLSDINLSVPRPQNVSFLLWFIRPFVSGLWFVCSGWSNWSECFSLETESITVVEDGDILERETRRKMSCKN